MPGERAQKQYIYICIYCIIYIRTNCIRRTIKEGIETHPVNKAGSEIDLFDPLIPAGSVKWLILMQLDLHPVEKSPFRTFVWACTPTMLGIGLPHLRMSRRFLQQLSRAVSRFSRVTVAGNYHHHFFYPTGSNTTITIPDRIEKSVLGGDPMGVFNRVWSSWIEKVLTVISGNYPPVPAGNRCGHILEKKLRFILRRGRPNSNTFWAKAANLLKGAFPTDSKKVQLQNNWPGSMIFLRAEIRLLSQRGMYLHRNPKKSGRLFSQGVLTILREIPTSIFLFSKDDVLKTSDCNKEKQK